MEVINQASLQWHHNGRVSVSNHQPHDCLLKRLFGCRSKKPSKLRVTGLCAGNSPVTGEFPAQAASNAENVSIWWRHHEKMVCYRVDYKSISRPIIYICIHIYAFHWGVIKINLLYWCQHTDVNIASHRSVKIRKLINHHLVGFHSAFGADNLRLNDFSVISVNISRDHIFLCGY